MGKLGESYETGGILTAGGAGVERVCIETLVGSRLCHIK